MNISVCMAAFNGEKFIANQIDSIINQLDDDDELIIVDDGSIDNTVLIVKHFIDNRIQLVQNEVNIGVNGTFEKAISLATKNIIFLADQDDVWVEGRVLEMKRALNEAGKFVLSSNSEYIDSNGIPTVYSASLLKTDDSNKYMRNILGIFAGTAPYFGCAMAFRKVFVGLILPFPKYIESHDLWIVMASNLIRSNIHLENVTLKRRVHGNNASIISRTLRKKIWSRVILLVSIIHLCIRVMRNIALVFDRNK